MSQQHAKIDPDKRKNFVPKAKDDTGYEISRLIINFRQHTAFHCSPLRSKKTIRRDTLDLLLTVVLSRKQSRRSKYRAAGVQ